MAQPHIGGGEADAAIDAPAEVLHLALLPRALRQRERFEKRFVDAQRRWAQVGAERLLQLRAEKIAQLLPQQRPALFLCDAAEKHRAADPAEKQRRRQNGPQRGALHREKRDDAAHSAGKPHQPPHGGHLLIMPQLPGERSIRHPFHPSGHAAPSQAAADAAEDSSGRNTNRFAVSSQNQTSSVMPSPS